MSHLKILCYTLMDLIHARHDDQLRWHARRTDHMASDVGLAAGEETNHASTRAIC
jgi:hypothetical protein